ncbi:MAG: efflux transporter periplasmic adaptor subunit [Fibrobacteria bacterium]|jgi:membrane fusion protein (multidrug efflux system)|nr:efflux transporter periplasmic adaptor subunit [Fibrobacteria bacterium]
MKPQYLTLAGLAVTAALLAACGGEKKEDPSKVKKVTADTANAVSVVTVVVHPRAFEDWGTYSADLRGADDAVLTAPAPGGGRVNKVTVVGANVTKGQALCDIDAELYGAQLKQAQAAVELAKGELDRAKNNVAQGFVGEAVLSKAELDYQAARVALLQSQRAYESSRCQAPFSGVLVSRSIEQFQTAAPGTPTLRVAGLSRLEAVLSIPESEAMGYKEGQRAEFRLLQEGSSAIGGRISSLDRAVESTNRVVTARVQIPNPGNRLRPGMIGKVNVLRARHEAALVVASQAVLRLQEGTVVMRVEGGKATRVPVKLGASKGDSVVVSSGLSAGDRVITVGAFQVSEGTRVKF